MGNHSKRPQTMPPLNRVKVEVIANPGPGGTIAWSHEIKTPGHSNGNKVKLPKGTGCQIDFDLDTNGQDVRFDADAPFFCKDGTADPCPSSLTSEQVMVDSCDDDKLIVFDWNYGNPVDLRYQLNFVTKVGERVNPYDPIIENGGGSIRPTFNNS
ncbi:hypothetical protein [Sphingomonas edaphi]|uniref:Uncharacterized protein n=1 Tax=Sphingomonas edaphi TaxID=2315689 RepID=A0A418Q3X5_9SPHN|nr:hypothetical protein [Sphingomonas edaphi]RIX32601.1 hypothetical protein D3M59_06680 [Sphingomonas edaphi]